MLFSILLVEGDERHRWHLSAFLGRSLAPAQVHAASTVAEARVLAQAHKVHVVLSAAHLDDGEALQVLALAPQAMGLVIVSRGQEARAAQALRDGFADFAVRDGAGHYYLTLPAQIRALLERLSLRQERLLAQDAMRRLAYIDELTQLPNRRGVLEALHAALHASEVRGGCVLLLGLDGFKDINAGLGQEWGDQVLRRLAQWLQARKRPQDVLGRWGGDEFVLLMPDLAPTAAQAKARALDVAQMLQTELARALLLGERSLYLQVSLGLAEWGDEVVSAEVLVQRAAMALGHAKQSNKKAPCSFTPQLQAAVVQRTALAEELRRALACDELVLYFQPLVHASGAVQGVEVLVRWQHPVKGLIPPGVFIPVAEQAGLIAQLDRMVLRKACEQLQRWAGHPVFGKWTVSVNLSAQEFGQADFVARIHNILQVTRAPAHLLKLELTESLMLQDVEQTAEKMKAIAAWGVRFSLDDFGTGYSALSYLKRLPLAQLKLDRCFVQGAGQDACDAAIVSTVIGLGKKLGLEVVAEGVETPLQHAFLLEAGCACFQGFLYGKPVPEEALQTWVNI